MKKFLPAVAWLLNACNSVFYQPLSQDLYDPKRLKLQYSDESIPTSDGVKLAAWWFKPLTESKKKILVQFHGNAENMTSHFFFVAWLTQDGVDVLTFDYRGYGRSSPVSPNREGLIEDGCAVLRWVGQQPALKDHAIYVLGQSLGGAVSISTLAACPNPQVKGLIVDSSFSSYRRIAREKLGSFFLTWPLQYPLSYFVTDDHSPIDVVDQLPMKKIFFHGPQDPVVPYVLGRELFDRATSPKSFVDVTYPGHIQAFGYDDSPYRGQLRGFLSSGD